MIVGTLSRYSPKLGGQTDDNLGTITVSVEVTAENEDNLLEALTTNKADFVDEITIDTANKKVMIKSFDGKESCYYVIVNSNSEGEGA